LTKGRQRRTYRRKLSGGSGEDPSGSDSECLPLVARNDPLCNICLNPIYDEACAAKCTGEEEHLFHASCYDYWDQRWYVHWFQKDQSARGESGTPCPVCRSVPVPKKERDGCLSRATKKDIKYGTVEELRAPDTCCKKLSRTLSRRRPQDLRGWFQDPHPYHEIEFHQVMDVKEGRIARLLEDDTARDREEEFGDRVRTAPDMNV